VIIMGGLSSSPSSSSSSWQTASGKWLCSLIESSREGTLKRLHLHWRTFWEVFISSVLSISVHPDRRRRRGLMRWETLRRRSVFALDTRRQSVSSEKTDSWPSFWGLVLQSSGRCTLYL
jgi:hypothetical protein